MALGPIEIVVIAFPGNHFHGDILPELRQLVASDTISVIDGLLVRKDADGVTTYVELNEHGANPEADELSSVIERIDGLISDDDIAELTADIEVDSSAAILVFEHTWVKPLRDAVVTSGGVLLESIRVPGAVVDEVLREVAALPEA